MQLQAKSELFLAYPFDKFELARKVKLGKISVEILNRIMMFTFENLILCDDVARLTVNDVYFGNEAVYFTIFLNHIPIR